LSKVRGKRVTFTDHARERQIDRNIKTSEIVETIKNPDSSMPAKNIKRTKHRKKFSGSAIQVIFIEKEKEILIVTVTKD